MTEESPTVEVPVVTFIADLPADEDFFDTHTRLAQAIVKTVGSRSEVKVIGLLGRWGSGKSTVAKKVVVMLEPATDTGFRVFTYDAWLHQNDPLRRSFLESLIQFLLAGDAIAKTRWQGRLRALTEPTEETRTIETPTLSTYGRWLSLSLVAVPVGIGFLDLDTFKEAFRTGSTLGLWTFALGLLLVATPVIAWAAIYFWRRPWRTLLKGDGTGLRPTVRNFFTSGDGEPSSPLRLFVDGHAKRTDTRTFRSAEPTSLEFGRTFQELMVDVQARRNRLVILIDNLDRIAGDEALRMWATIRSFFLATGETDETEPEPYHPTVILPVDRHAIEDLFSRSDDAFGRDRAKSFMDKTFDVTFEVTEPVSSDWRAYLERQMEHMFGEAYEPRWGFLTKRMFEAQLASSSDPGSGDGRRPQIVTPREINKTLNRIGALYLQWHGERIPVEVMALFVIRREEIDRGLLAFIQDAAVDLPPSAGDWRLQIAALYYGVKLDKAAQVTLDQPVRRAIVASDQRRFASLSSIPGFPDTLDAITADLPRATAPAGPFDVISSAATMLSSLEKLDEQSETSAWRNLVNAFLALDAPITVSAGAMAAIGLLAARAEPELREPFLTSATARITEVLGTAQAGPGAEREVRDAAAVLVAFATQHGLATPTFLLGGTAIEDLTRFAELADAPALWPRLRTQHDGTAITDAIDAMLADRDQQVVVPTIVGRLRLPNGRDFHSGDAPVDLDRVATTAADVARQPQAYDAESQAAIDTLVALVDSAPAAIKLLPALVDDGTMANRLAEAVSARQWGRAATILAITIWRGGSFAHPTSIRWSDIEELRPQFVDEVLSALERQFPGSIVRSLWGSRDKNSYPTTTLLERIIHHAVAEDRLGEFDADVVFAALSKYRLALPYRLWDRFLEQVERRRDFLKAIEDEPIGPQTLEVTKYLQRKGGESAAKVEAIVRQSIEGADRSMWESALLGGTDLFALAMEQSKVDAFGMSRRSGLFDALEAQAVDVARTTDRDVRTRWFALAELLKSGPRKALFAVLGGALSGSDPSRDLQTMKAGGVQFLKGGAFGKNADQSIRRLVVPFLQQRTGREWLKDNQDEVGHWISLASQSARDETAQALAKLSQSRREERRYTADLLAAQWKLNDPSAPKT